MNVIWENDEHHRMWVSGACPILCQTQCVQNCVAKPMCPKMPFDINSIPGVSESCSSPRFHQIIIRFLPFRINFQAKEPPTTIPETGHVHPPMTSGTFLEPWTYLAGYLQRCLVKHMESLKAATVAAVKWGASKAPIFVDCISSIPKMTQ